MGLFRKQWPHRRYLAGQASFKALRNPGPKLWPHPQKRGEDLAPLPDALESLPGTVQCAVKKGVQQALRDRSNLGWVGLASLPPQNAAPFKSQPLNRSYDVIVGGGHAAQQAAASELQAAIVGAAVQAGATAAPVIVTNPANSVTQSTPASFLTLNPQAYERMHVSGVECAASSLDAYSNLLFTVQLDGLTVLDHVPLDALAELSLDVKPLGQLAFLVTSSDAAAVYLVRFTPKGWRYPVPGLGDYESEALYRADPDGREAEDAGAVSDTDWLRDLAGSVNTGGCE
jgi:hypothetical protein